MAFTQPLYAKSTLVLPDGETLPLELKLIRCGDVVFFELRKFLNPLYRQRKTFSIKEALGEQKGNWMVACKHLNSTMQEDLNSTL